MIDLDLPQPLRPGSNLLLEVIFFLEPRAKEELRNAQNALMFGQRVRFVVNPSDETSKNFIREVDFVAVLDPLSSALTLHHVARELRGRDWDRAEIFRKFGDILEQVAKRHYENFSGNLVALGIAIMGFFQARGLGDRECLKICHEQVEKYEELIALEGNIPTTLGVIGGVERIFRGNVLGLA